MAYAYGNPFEADGMSEHTTNSPVPPDRRTLRPGDIEQLQILRNVSREAVFGILEHCEVIDLAPGTVLLSRGQRNRRMFLVIEGELTVCIDDVGEENVAVIDVGQTVGELSVIDDSPASADVCATTAARLIAVDESTFWRLVKVSHEFAANMLFLLASRLRENNQIIREGLSRRRILEKEATVDALTGLRNRRWLDENLTRLALRHQFSKKPFSVVMVDVDHFKNFNDQFGHSAGDQVLAAVGTLLARRLRPTDLVSRYGGEEFCIMLPETPLDGACIAAERIRRNIEDMPPLSHDGQSLPRVTASFGVACMDGDETGTDVLRRADEALYRAKTAGRNQVSV